MKYAIFSDIHGSIKKLKAIVESIYITIPDANIISLGDNLDALVSKNTPIKKQKLKYLCDTSEEFIAYYSSIRTLIGNQEERILERLETSQFSESLLSLLTAPEVIDLQIARLIHGHQFSWIHLAGITNYFPVITEENFNMRQVLIYGHNHQNALFAVEFKGDTSLIQPIDIKYGSSFQLQADQKYLINIGQNRNSKVTWLLFDDAHSLITFYQVDISND